jgi:hypothetical protein
MYVLPDTTLFVAANRGAMIFNWRTNTEQRLPNFPNNVRVTLVYFQVNVDNQTEISLQLPLPVGWSASAPHL